MIARYYSEVSAPQSLQIYPDGSLNIYRNKA